MQRRQAEAAEGVQQAGTWDKRTAERDPIKLGVAAAEREIKCRPARALDMVLLHPLDQLLHREGAH